MVFLPDSRLYLGAEAEVWSGLWMGKPAVRKLRRNRAWRHPDLEKRLGYRRMLSEARILNSVKELWITSSGNLGCRFGEWSHSNGENDWRPLIEVLRDHSLTKQQIRKALFNTGTSVRMLHRLAVTHGDLSTNNILIDEDFNAALIDFGLSAVEYEVERFGIDLHVMDEILGASHPNIDNAIDVFWMDIDSVMIGKAQHENYLVVNHRRLKK